MKKISFIAFTLLIVQLLGGSILNAQTDDSEKSNPFSMSCDLVSRYVWRGTDFGASPSIQPGIEFNKNGFSAGVWGAYAFNSIGAQEADLYVSYTIKDKVTLLVTDYYFPDDLSDYNYFNYNSETTGHILETSMLINGTEGLPLSFLLAVNVWGDDARRYNANDSVTKIQHSAYAELTYSFKYFDAFMGMNLTNPDEDLGEIGYYGSSVGVVNLGISATKDINITKTFSLPLTISLITNPQAEKIFLTAGISL